MRLNVVIRSRKASFPFCFYSTGKNDGRKIVETAAVRALAGPTSKTPSTGASGFVAGRLRQGAAGEDFPVFSYASVMDRRCNLTIA